MKLAYVVNQITGNKAIQQETMINASTVNIRYVNIRYVNIRYVNIYTLIPAYLFDYRGATVCFFKFNSCLISIYYKHIILNM